MEITAEMVAFDALVDSEPAPYEFLRISDEVDRQIIFSRLTWAEQHRMKKQVEKSRRYLDNNRAKINSKKPWKTEAHRKAAREYYQRNKRKINLERSERSKGEIAMTKYTCPECKATCYTSDPHCEKEDCPVCGHAGMEASSDLGIKKDEQEATS